MSEEKSHSRQNVTQLLQASRAGDQKAINDLMPLVYDEMKNIAHQKLRFERNGHTLDTTALVHEAYFKLINHEEVEWQSRAHFLGVAALAMKRILINYAEYKQAVKRGGDYSRVKMEEIRDPDSVHLPDSTAEQILALDEALERMKTFNERGSKVVEYHFFGGLTWDEISTIMGVAPITVRRAWNAARLWLNRELNQKNRGQLSL
ncbi:ECF-type sigma factor [Rhodohalobacter mucosus]|uniref:RNA polymerase subunit sigma-70 n=1 Tax=Rhodohalobacter mucosus TaxID=2079485 RepID=A0A316TXA7_9BACT|nr:ECF-type sigma factor [Rhodohalobacter mucosus]PWN07905.1 RNA polymerase subunit sigma-70 [Rhodohalobacter mucosus]